ncbi:MAG: hypothetical protein HBSAPP03_07570 [Phycisphaerae bacterium]|nr:MAG: hypothetical protein HBSAPP03_07570 [Phycisphaerae bacterium]
MTARIVGIAAVVLSAGAVLGQGVPQSQTWLWQRLPCTDPNDPQTCIPVDPLFVSMESVQVHSPWEHPDPIVAARTLAQRIVNHIAWGQQTADTTAIFLHGWGHDGKHTDCSCTNDTECDCCCADVYTTPTRFFCEADRLVGLDDIEFPDFEAPDRSDRAYRHPFLKNATKAGPLRAWTMDFMAELEKIRTLETDPLYLPHLPNGDNHAITWTFDTESHIAAYQGVNSLFMLHTLADDYPEIWNSWTVPGSPGWEPPNAWPSWNATNQAYDTMPSNAPGMTLAELYAAARAVYTNWPADITDDQNGGIDLGEDPTHPTNRKFLVWWYSIARRAEDAVMAVSGYDEIKAVWTASVCSNYDNARTDGETDTFGWFLDRDNAYALEAEYTRGIIYRQPSSVLMARDNGHDRWINVYQWASGERDAPQLYPLTATQVTGWAPGQGHGQASPYLPSGTLCCVSSCSDAEFEYCRLMNSLRLDRQDVESILNSAGGSPARLAPWIIQPILETYTNPFDYYEDEAGLRWLLAMLRAKRVPELVLWTGSRDRQEQYAAWLAAQSLIRRVWTPAITHVEIVSGSMPHGADEPETAMLEDTLRGAGGLPYQVAIEPKNVNVFNGTMLQVTFEIQNPAYLQFDYGLEVNVECTVNQANVVGRVFVWDFHASDWYQVPTEEGPAINPSYQFYTPDFATRRRFVVNDPHVDFVEDGVIMVRLDHERIGGSSTYPVRSAYDLVQIVPYYLEAGGMGGAALLGGGSIPRCAVNQNGEVTTADLEMFVEAWVEGSPLADLNQDGWITMTDLDAFEASLATHGP